MPGTSSAWRAAHIGTRSGGDISLLEAADAIFIDYAANDMIVSREGSVTSNDDPFAAQRATFEVRVRRLLLLKATQPPGRLGSGLGQ